MQCTSPIWLTKNLNPVEYPDGLTVPCGKCLACRIQRRNQWVVRLTHELSCHDDSIFVTLTYSDNYLPENGSLDKKALQKFFKRLRKISPPIKYFACGEYGEEKQRPHYHAIIFGLSLQPAHKKMVMDCWPFCDWDNLSIRTGAFGLAEPDSIRYVAAYVESKLSGFEAQVMYDDVNRSPVFKLASQALGLNYFVNNKDQIISNKEVSLYGVKYSVPRYYLKKAGLSAKEFLGDDARASEIDFIENLTGVAKTFDELYRQGSVTKELVDEIADGREQRKRNLHAKLKLKSKKL